MDRLNGMAYNSVVLGRGALPVKKTMFVVVASARLSCIQIDRSRATELFLFIQGVPGKATQVPHADWIRVESAAWGHDTKIPFEPLAVTKVLDFSSPRPALAAADGRHFNTAILHFQKPGALPMIFLKSSLPM